MTTERSGGKSSGRATEKFVAPGNFCLYVSHWILGHRSKTQKGVRLEAQTRAQAWSDGDDGDDDNGHSGK